MCYKMNESFMMKNILTIQNREEFRMWLSQNCQSEKECYVQVKRIKPDGITFTYLDAVEEALCFGWIDSIYKKIDGIHYQRFSPRKKNSPWSELNKARARRLIALGWMTPEGEKVLPKDKYHEDKDVVFALKKARVYTKFKAFPPLYQRVRMYNVSFYKNRDEKTYQAALKHLIEKTKNNEMFGEWNDYGRLS